MSEPPTDRQTDAECFGHSCMTGRRSKCCTCYKIPKSNSSQSDDHEVEGLERRPALDVFEDGCWERHEQQAAEQHEQQGGDNPDLCLTDVPVLQGHKQREALIDQL